MSPPDLSTQPWLTDPDVQAVMDAIEAAGGQVRFVGGCVRNALIGAPVDDVDIATTLIPDHVVKALTNAGLRSAPTGLAHGTVTAIASGRGFEVTTLRRDVTTDGRNATVAFTDDWADDAARRDFRLNAIYADRRGRIFDSTGQGVADALTGRIIFVGDPETRIREDYLRILRFFRFLAWYGKGAPDEGGLRACAALKAGMARLSAERIEKELMKLLAAPDPRPAMRAMADSGVLTVILPEAVAGALFEATVGLTRDPIVRLSVLVPADASVVAAVSRRLRFPNATLARLTAAAGALSSVSLEMTEAQTREAVYRHGRRATEDALYRRWSEDPARSTDAGHRLTLTAAWEPPPLPVSGRDLARLGVERGPRVGRILKAFEEGWIQDDFPDAGHMARLRAAVLATG